MIVSLFRRNKKNANPAIVDKIYAEIISAARTQHLFANLGVPDTPLGRYESLSAHMIVFLHRTRQAGTLMEALAQDVLDEFFKDVDHSIRELGIGDVGVPKRMKKLGKMFYGRMGPYWQSLDDGDMETFAEALQRNIRPEEPEKLDGHALAAHLTTLRDRMADMPDDIFLNGTVRFAASAAQGT